MSGTHHHVRTASLEIAYEEQGDAHGSPVILVHGFPDDVRTWDAVVEALVGAGYRTLVPYVRGFGPTRFLDPTTVRAGQIAALGQDLLDFADALRIPRFAIMGHDWGGRAAYVVAALWPERVRVLVVISVPYGTRRPGGSISAAQARAYWYQWYFHTEQGRATLENDRRALCRFLWETWSPRWKFADQAFEATAQSFDNPDFVEVVIHYYRHPGGTRLGTGATTHSNPGWPGCRRSACLPRCFMAKRMGPRCWKTRRTWNSTSQDLMLGASSRSPDTSCSANSRRSSFRPRSTSWEHTADAWGGRSLG